ncbi:hypothetical protein BD770DRAFT_295372, partial [Pilaira anomala]
KLDNAVRALSAPSTDNQGFSYVYYPAKSRISRKIQRKNLQTLGVTNSRILDIHYPSRNIVALLVHNDYKDDLINLLKSKGVNNLSDYSPLHPSAIADPQFKDLTESEKRSLAMEKNNNRLVRALPFIRDHISTAVARYFEDQRWISKSQLE